MAGGRTVRVQGQEARARFPRREWQPRVMDSEEGVSLALASRGFGVGVETGTDLEEDEGDGPLVIQGPVSNHSLFQIL
jgi:hypothetical protein